MQLRLPMSPEFRAVSSLFPVPCLLLPPEAFQAMVYDMRGKKQEAEAITSKMKPQEGMAMMGAALQLFGKCVMGQQ
jgi:hypothetical protein